MTFHMRRATICVVAIILLSSLFVLSFHGSFVYKLSGWRAIPQPNKNAPGASMTAPGVGFDLTTSYGTAAIRHQNGSLDVVGKVDADEEYEKMMRRLSIPPKRPTCPPYAWRTWPEIRRLVGLPASSDVVRLAKLLTSLRSLAESQLGAPIISAVTSYPKLPALCKEDIDDALRRAGLIPLTSRTQVYQPHSMSAAYAGYSLGLCQHYLDLSRCRIEEGAMSVYETLQVSFTGGAMINELLLMRGALDSYSSNLNHLVDYESGLEHADRYSDPEAYWQHVQVRLLELPLRRLQKTEIDQILLLGDSALNSTFRKVLEDTILKLQSDLPKIQDGDPLYAAAKGAAEFAKRAQEDRTKWYTTSSSDL